MLWLPVAAWMKTPAKVNVIECYMAVIFGCYMVVIWMLYGCCGFCIRILHTYLTYLLYLSYLTSLDMAFLDIFFRVFQSLSETFRPFRRFSPWRDIDSQVMCRLQRDGMHA